jgi:hypothetical protein
MKSLVTHPPSESNLIDLIEGGIPNVIELIASGKLRGYCVSVQRSPSRSSVRSCSAVTRCP